METALSVQSGRWVLAAITVLVGAAAAALLAAGLPLHGLVLGAAVLFPYLLYLAFTRPLAFPFGLYVLLVPIDNILSFGSFGTITKLLGIVSGAFLLLWIVRRGVHTAPLKAQLLPLVLLILWMFVSVYWALDQRVAVGIIPTYAGLMLLFVALTFTPLSARDFQAILVCVIVGGIGAAAYGANVFFHHPNQEQLDTGRLIIEVGNSSIDPNHFANSLLFPAAALGIWALRTARAYAKVAGLAGSGLMLAAIMYSGSREALAAFAAIVVYYFLRTRYRVQVALAALAAFAAAVSTQTTMWTRFSTVFLTGGSGRTSIWAVAIEAAKHRLLQGYGIGNFEQAYDLYYLAVPQAYPYGWSSPAHNIIFHYVVEIGLVGMLLILWFYGSFFFSLRSVKRGSPLYDYRVMLEASLIAIAIVAFNIDLFTYKYAWLVFSAAALLCNAAAYQQQREEILAQSSDMMAERPLRA
ncbi:MAG TPA: O-antigen ligase family protein [Candidatus Baltobacteraceae bacterium]|nr:O-antigen ligase family protein [Candidatus Baltobacteraceae bacterium]